MQNRLRLLEDMVGGDETSPTFWGSFIDAFPNDIDDNDLGLAPSDPDDKV